MLPKSLFLFASCLQLLQLFGQLPVAEARPRVVRQQQVICSHNTTQNIIIVDCINRNLSQITQAQLPDRVNPNRRIYLDLSFNPLAMQLQAGAFPNRTDITWLRMKRCQIGRAIQSRAFVNMPQLQHLDLDDNHIETIIPTAFAGVQLRELILSRNNFTILDGLFQAGLRLLDLRYNFRSFPTNPQTQLQRSSFANPQVLENLTKLHLAGGNWQCDCTMFEHIVPVIERQINRTAANDGDRVEMPTCQILGDETMRRWDETYRTNTDLNCITTIPTTQSTTTLPPTTTMWEMQPEVAALYILIIAGLTVGFALIAFTAVYFMNRKAKQRLTADVEYEKESNCRAEAARRRRGMSRPR